MIRIRRVRQQGETELERYRSKGTMAKKWRTSEGERGITFNYYTHYSYTSMSIIISPIIPYMRSYFILELYDYDILYCITVYFKYLFFQVIDL